MKSFYIFFVFLFVVFKSLEGSAQVVSNTLGQTNGYIPTAVPFLLINPDARSNGMGGVGAATTADLNSIHWNAAKLGFLHSDFGISVSYMPWLRQLLNDVNYYNISGFINIDSSQKIGCSLKYFSLGSIDYVNNAGVSLGEKNPEEYSIDLAYSKKISIKTSVGIAIRQIKSDALSPNVFYYPFPESFKTFAFDLSLFHFNPIKLFKKQSQISYGISLTNIGPLIKDKGDSVRFLPANLRIGTSLKSPFNETHSVEVSFDANKLLAPDNPGNYCDSTMGICTTPMEPKSWAEGFFGSFSDAQDGFNEELNEIYLSAGVEYWFKHLIALRTGYFYENHDKGNRKYMTLGAGIRYSIAQLDVSYLIVKEQRNPLENTISFTLSFYF
jgi:hypothetical protein